jgi:hypothetical protein
VAIANSLAVVFEYLGGAVGLTVAGTINKQAVFSRFKRIPAQLVVRVFPVTLPLSLSNTRSLSLSLSPSLFFSLLVSLSP